MDFSRFTHLTFDCYGTLIDWETGILEALRPVIQRHGVHAEEARILRQYAEHEARVEGGPYRRYVDVLREAARGIAADLDFLPSEEDLDALPESVGRWPVFPDTVESLSRLAERYKLVILSNIDDSLFAETRMRLKAPFEDVITAQQVGSYKPNPAHFHRAVERLGIGVEQVLHVAQSLYHDHAPAQSMGFSTVRIDRPSRLAGTGIAPPSAVIPNLQFVDIQTFADLALAVG